MSNDSQQKYNYFTRGALTLKICLLTLALVALLSYIFISSPTQGQVFIDMASSPAPVFGVVVDPGLKVVEVEPGSAAEQSGIQPGDKLEELDGKPLTSPSACHSYHYSQRPKNYFESTTYPASGTSRRPNRYARASKFWLFLAK